MCGNLSRSTCLPGRVSWGGPARRLALSAPLLLKLAHPSTRGPLYSLKAMGY